MPAAIDVSNYTGPITPEQARALREAGVRRVVVGTQYPDAPYPPGVAHHQIPVLLEAGLAVEAYVYLWLGGGAAGVEDARRQVAEARERLAPWRGDIGRVWLDVEDTSASALRPAERLHAVSAAIEALGDVPTGIYTGAWYWRQAMADTAACAHLPLWVARYDGAPDLAFEPFGGWTRAAMKQYAADATLVGLSGIDLDWYEETVTPLTEAEFGWAFAALYRGLAPGQLPIEVTWAPAIRADGGEERHTLLVRGRTAATDGAS